MRWSLEASLPGEEQEGQEVVELSVAGRYMVEEKEMPFRASPEEGHGTSAVTVAKNSGGMLHIGTRAGCDCFLLEKMEVIVRNSTHA